MKPRNTYLFGIKPLSFIRIGLAFVFLANSLTAFFMPSEFIELIESSFLKNILPMSTTTMVIGIGINDALVSILLLLNFCRKWLAIWAVIWITGVMVVKGITLGNLEESAFLLMALSLIKSTQESSVRS